jgi:hypothetical protein
MFFCSIVEKMLYATRAKSVIALDNFHVACNNQSLFELNLRVLPAFCRFATRGAANCYLHTPPLSPFQMLPANSTPSPIVTDDGGCLQFLQRFLVLLRRSFLSFCFGMGSRTRDGKRAMLVKTLGECSYRFIKPLRVY